MVVAGGSVGGRGDGLTGTAVSTEPLSAVLVAGSAVGGRGDGLNGTEVCFYAVGVGGTEDGVGCCGTVVLADLSAVSAAVSVADGAQDANTIATTNPHGRRRLVIITTQRSAHVGPTIHSSPSIIILSAWAFVSAAEYRCERAPVFL